MRSRVRRYVSSYLTRGGRGFYPEFFRFLSDVSVPLADDKISNEKLVLFGQIFLRKTSTKMRIIVSREIIKRTVLHRVIIKQLFCIVQSDNSIWIATTLAIIFEVPVFRKMAAPASCHAVCRPKYIGPRLIQ